MIAQLLGILGFLLSIISFQQNTQKRIVFVQFLANISFTIHFYLIGAYTGSILNGIAIVRSFVYCFKDKKWASSNIWIVIFSLAFIVAGIYTWEGPLSILPTTAMVLSSVSFGIKNPKLVRRIYFPCSPMWLIYNIVGGSIGGVLTECFAMVSIIIGMLRFDRKKK
ncbi:MAG: YgjV family protein [Ruminococcaceae bacterium]|nr:YgjV family protein [Oscillospiraceae bacterium]